MILKTIILLLLISGSLLAKPTIRERLDKIEGIKVSEIYTKDGFLACFKIMVKQPVDHADTKQGFFYQKVFLSHKSVDEPMVMSINGYVSATNQISDWTSVLDANQIYIEHRYFGESRPDTMNYTHLNISNTTKDLHRIREIFGEIYTKGWLSTGISKGGLTALSYRYFFPKDVDATIALSTSVKTTKCDSSFFHYIDSLNVIQGCKKELEAFQKTLLSHKEEVIPHLENYLHPAGREFSQLGLKAIYEIAVLEIPFSIWQNGNGCSSIDYSITDPKELFEEMKSSLHGWFLTDEVFNRINPYHYQALTELGHYCYPVTRFSKLLESDFEKLTPVQTIPGIKISYSNQSMLQIKTWAESEGNQIIYISGGDDPYSKHRVVPSKSLDAKSFILEGKNHNQVHTSNLNKDTLRKIMETIMEWIRK
jgi:hypothetical protein